MPRRKQFRSEDIARSGKPPDCTECSKRPTCRKLCPDVEHWVNQDHVGHNNTVVILQNWDHPISFNSFLDRAELNLNGVVVPDPDVADEAWETVESLNLPKKSFEFAKLYYREGKSIPQVASALKISAQACTYRHRNLKKEIRKRFERLEVWKKHKEDVENNYILRHQVVIEMFYNILIDRKEIAKLVKMHYTHVTDILSQFRKQYLDI